MRRYAANILYCSPYNLLKNGVVEIDEQKGVISDIFSLDNFGDEVHSTVFLNGIILPFKPVFTPDMYGSNLFVLLKEQFLKNVSCEIACFEKIDLWVLQGGDLFGEGGVRGDWRVTRVLTWAL